MTRRTALVVGAGIGGLASGIALQRAGWEVRIFERAASPRELGFGLLLAPNALSALEELGLASPIVSAGAPPGRVEIRRRDGAVIRRLNAQLGGPSIVALRATLHGTLLDAIGPEPLRLSAQAVSFSDAGDRVVLRCADGSSDEGHILVGADGVDSVIRRQLHPGEPAPVPSGYAAIRGVTSGAGQQLGELSAAVFLDGGFEAAAVTAGEDAIYWYVSLLAAEVHGTSPLAILEPWLSGADPAFQAIVAATAPGDMRFDPLFRREALPTWGAGRVTLLGDAAHPLLPHTGQGAAQSLEDAVALGLAMQGDDGVTGLRAYERVRQKRTAVFVRLGPRLARVTTTRNPAIALLRTGALRLLPEGLLARSTAALREDPHRALRTAV